MTVTHPVLDELRQRAADARQRYGELVRAVATKEPFLSGDLDQILRAANKTEADLVADAELHQQALSLLDQIRESQQHIDAARNCMREREELETEWTARRNAVDAEFQPKIDTLKAKTSRATDETGRIAEARRKLSLLNRPPGWIDGALSVQFAGERMKSLD